MDHSPGWREERYHSGLELYKDIFSTCLGLQLFTQWELIVLFHGKKAVNFQRSLFKFFLCPVVPVLFPEIQPCSGPGTLQHKGFSGHLHASSVLWPLLLMLNLLTGLCLGSTPNGSWWTCGTRDRTMRFCCIGSRTGKERKQRSEVLNWDVVQS